MSAFFLASGAGTDRDEIWDYYASELQNPDVGDRVRG